MLAAFRIVMTVAGVAGLAAIPPFERPAVESSQSASHPDSAAVVSIVAGYHEALASGDSLRALSLLALDAIILESGGMETRAEYRSHHLSGDIKFAKSVKSTAGPLHVMVAGNAAWTASTSTTQGTFNGRTINSAGAESMVLTKGSDGWKIRAIHWSSRTRRSP